MLASAWQTNAWTRHSTRYRANKLSPMMLATFTWHQLKEASSQDQILCHPQPGKLICHAAATAAGIEAMSLTP